MSFMVHKFKQLQIPMRQTVVIDTIGLSKMIFQYETSHSLDKIMARLGIPKSGDRHRSLDDSRYTAQALIELIKLLEQQQIKTLPEVESAFVKPESLFRQEKAKSRSLF
jgi:DNA polymerase III alpha subunit (gram-positive type)